MAKKSTGLCNTLLKASGATVADTFDGGFLLLYSGTAPDTADAAYNQNGGVLVAKLTESGDGSTGLTFDSPAVLGVLYKAAAETWKVLSADILAGTHTVTWFRFVTGAGVAVTGTSTTEPRIQGVVGRGGAVDMVLGDPDFVGGGGDRILPSFNIYLTPT